MREVLPASAMPRHVAFIMDGNGRWATQRGLERSAGHRKGAQTMLDLIEYCVDLAIESVTVYAFSTENWSRPKSEISQLMGMVVDFFKKYAPRAGERNLQIRFLGDLSPLPVPTREACERAAALTAKNTGMICNIALNYGGRAEILRAASRLAAQVQDGVLTPAAITAADFEAQLYTAGQPDVDLLVRTAGECRLSGFLLYQCAYAEFVVVPEYWPDFTPAVFDRVLLEYAGRERKMGGLKT